MALSASRTFPVFYCGAPCRSLCSTVLKGVSYLSYKIIMLLLEQKSLLIPLFALSYTPLYVSTPEGGAALFRAAQRNEPNTHQFQPVLERTCVRKGSFVWSVTVFPVSLPFRSSSASWKGPCSWSLDWFTLNPSDLSAIWEPFEHASASTRLTL